MQQKLDTQYIRSVANKNGYSIGLFSFLILISVGILYFNFADSAKLPLLFLMGVAIVGFIIAICKIQEPDVSFMINQQGILYHHKRGFLLIEWQNIQRMGIPQITHGFEQKELAYIGINLKNAEVMLPSISLRLISHLLIEQRAIFHQYLRQSCYANDCCPTELSLNTEPYYAESGFVYKGLRGMFAHRMKYLKEMSGYDIFLPENALDRSSEEFIKLLKSHHQESRLVNDNE